MIMDVSDLLKEFRVTHSDLAEPYLWEDSELKAYADDAQEWLCRRVNGIADTQTTEVVELSLTNGTSTYPLHQSVLKVRGARLVSENKFLLLIPSEAAQAMHLTDTPGLPRRLILGEHEGAVRFHPSPAADDTVMLSVFRLPLKLVADGEELEVNRRHHRALLLWMAHRAYSKPDTDVFDANRAETYRSQFLTYCVEAKAEQGRLDHPAGTVVYGGY
jgi:hypothetical protein